MLSCFFTGNVYRNLISLNLREIIYYIVMQLTGQFKVP